MKKKLYDFSKANAIVVLLAYAFLLLISLYATFSGDKISIIALIISLLLILSLVLVIWYYVFLAVTITEAGIKHGKKFIHKKDAKWFVEYNRRFRYNEIIIYNKYDNLDKLTKKDYKIKLIIVQYYPKHEEFLKEYFKLIKRKE